MKKVNSIYLLIYVILAYVPLGMVFFGIGKESVEYNIVVTLILGTPLLLIFILFMSKIIFKMQRRKAEKEFARKGFVIQSTFCSDSINVWIDVQQGKCAVVCKLNPFKVQYIPASFIQEAKTEIVKELVSKGTRCVRYVIKFDKAIINVNTLFAKYNMSLENPRVVEATKKAELQVSLLLEAKENAG